MYRKNVLAGGLAQQAVAMYEAGSTQSEVAKRFGVSRPAIGHQLRLLGGKVRHGPDVNRRYSLNEAAFDGRDEATFYWAGFLMADGCVYQRRHESPSLHLLLAVKDVGHLEKYRRFLGFNGPIREHPNRDGRHLAGVVSVYSARIADELTRFGVVRNKTHRATASPEAAASPHFWRGVFDGDGCISLGKTGDWHINLAGCKSLLEQFGLFLAENGITPTPKTTQGHRSHQLQAGGKKRPLSIARLLYEDSTIALDRKLALYNAMKLAVGD